MKRMFVNNNGRTKPVFEGERKIAAPDWSPAVAGAAGNER